MNLSVTHAAVTVAVCWEKYFYFEVLSQVQNVLGPPLLQSSYTDLFRAVSLPDVT